MKKMRNILRFLLFVLFSFVFIAKSFAIEAPINVNVESNSDTSVVITWDPLGDAIMYYVYYSKKSGINNGYENYSDFIEGNSVEIDGLEVGQDYYFAVTSLDENGEESLYSDEVLYEFSSVDVFEDEIDFVLDSISVVGPNKIEIDFSSPLDSSTGTLREFKIVNKTDSFDSFEVISSELNEDDTSIINLTLDRNVEVGNEYEVVVVAITSDTGETIELGIDNSETFFVNEEDILVNLNSANEDEETIDVNVEETSLIGVNIDASDIENTALVQAENQTALPQTGPEHVLLFILSIVLGTIIFIFKFKKA